MPLEHYILKGGEMIPASLLEWAAWFDAEPSNRVIAQTTVGPAWISTVFLGIDHGFGGTPLYFETMVFGGKMDQDQDRYGTLEEARLGHERMVGRVREAEGMEEL